MAQPAQMLSAIRVAVGVGAYGAPNLSGRLFGLDPAGNPQASFLGRLFGIRDVALGLGTLQTRDPAARRLWLQLGIACDAADVLSALLAGRGGVLPKHAALMSGAVAAIATGLGVAALAAEEG